MSSTLQTHVILSSKNVLTQTESFPPSVPFIACFRALGATADINDFTYKTNIARLKLCYKMEIESRIKFYRNV